MLLENNRFGCGRCDKTFAKRWNFYQHLPRCKGDAAQQEQVRAEKRKAVYQRREEKRKGNAEHKEALKKIDEVRKGSERRKEAYKTQNTKPERKDGKQTFDSDRDKERNA